MGPVHAICPPCGADGLINPDGDNLRQLLEVSGDGPIARVICGSEL